MNPDILPIPNVKRSLTIFQYLARALRVIATYFDGGTMPPSHTRDLAAEELADLRVKLFVAVRQKEQADHVVKYLEARINQLASVAR